MHSILQQIQNIQNRIHKCCEKIGRNPAEVRLLLATKTVTAERILTAFESGVTLIGENKIQELKEKYDALKIHPHTHHFIGHLQSNKIKDILKYDVACIQSIDRLELAEKLHQRLLATNRSIDILIQVNTSNEVSKFGVEPSKTIELVEQIATLSTLKIKGLMTIGIFSGEDEKVRACFKTLKNLQQQIQVRSIPNVEMKELSMGMSGDLEIAIEEGATIIRVGTAIFGQRNYPDSYYWNETSSKK